MAAPAQQTQDLRRSVARVAQYRPFGSGEVQVEYARREFVLAAAYENGGSFSSLADCQDVCKTLWGLELDLDEIRSVINRLKAEDKLLRDGGTYTLSDDARTELSERLNQSVDREAQAFDDWELHVKDLAPQLSSEHLAQLRDDLTTWLQQIITHYGIEAALLLYPEDDRARQFLEDVEELGFSFLPPRDASVEEVRPKALYSFIHNPTAAQRIYIANLLTTAYLVAIFTLDPRAKEVVQALTKGQKIYLDTNVVYAILNLSGPRAFLAIRRVLDLSRQLGYEICVTPWTVEEMKQSVRRARTKLAESVLPPRALAEIAAETSGDETFVTAYWRKYKETGISPKDFLDLHEQIDALLGKAGIDIVSTSCLAVDRDDDGIANQVALLETVPGGAEKSRPVQEHDVKHRLLIDRLRGDGNRRFSNGGYWFLTRDTVLAPYALAGRERHDTLPFAMSLMTWATIARSLCPRTDDYEQTLADLLDTPSIRPRGVVSPATIGEVLGRIDMLVEDSTEEIATRLLLDSAVMSAIEAKGGDEQRQRFIDSAVKDKKAEMENQLRDTKAEAARERTAREEAEQRAASVAAELARQRVEHDESERQRAETSRQALIAEEKAAAIAKTRDAEAQQHTDDLQSLTHRLEAQARLTRIAVGCGIGAVGLVLILLPVLTGWVSDGWPLVALILASGAVFLSAVAWIFGRRRATALAAAAAGAIGLVAAIQQMVSSDDPPPASPSRR